MTGKKIKMCDLLVYIRYFSFGVEWVYLGSLRLEYIFEFWNFIIFRREVSKGYRGIG